MEYQAKPGNEPPPHVHEWEHELYYVLEGAMEVYVEDKILLARAGFFNQSQPTMLSLRACLNQTTLD